jgi:putative ABC transport system ATP-binding protein
VGVASPAPALLVAQDLYRFFHDDDEETFALRGVSMTVSSGEMIAVVGPSGSGKSTLLACLAGLDEPDGGHVAVAGRRITRRPEKERSALRAKWIGMLLQSGNLIEHLTIAQNIRAAQAMVPDSTGPVAAELLKRLELGDRAAARPSTLSGGEQARAGLAVALANDPPVLLADEPTGEVDRDVEGDLLGLLRGRADDGGAVVVVTHNERVADEAHRVVRLVDGGFVDD